MPPVGMDSMAVAMPAFPMASRAFWGVQLANAGSARRLMRTGPSAACRPAKINGDGHQCGSGPSGKLPEKTAQPAQPTPSVLRRRRARQVFAEIGVAKHGRRVANRPTGLNELQLQNKGLRAMSWEASFFEV